MRERSRSSGKAVSGQATSSAEAPSASDRMLARQIVAVHAGQPDVDHHDVGPHALKRRQRGGAIGGHEDFVAVAFEHEAMHLPRVGQVFHHEHAPNRRA